MCNGLRNTPAASQAMSPATRAQVQQGTTFWVGYPKGEHPLTLKYLFFKKQKLIQIMKNISVIFKAIQGLIYNCMFYKKFVYRVIQNICKNIIKYLNKHIENLFSYNIILKLNLHLLLHLSSLQSSANHITSDLHRVNTFQ